jgi:HK97 family phage prohead protease
MTTMDIRERLEGTVEHRTFGASLELLDLGDGGGRPIRVTGYAATTEQEYDMNGAFTESIARGAFKRTLGEEPDVVFNINHGVGGQLPLARTKSKTLTLSEDARGLKVDAELDADDPDARAVAAKIRRGDVDAMSLAFRATSQTWSEDRSERLIRELSIHRGDVSLVSQPANESTSVALRSRKGRSAEKPVHSYIEIARARRAESRGAKHRAVLTALTQAWTVRRTSRDTRTRR